MCRTIQHLSLGASALAMLAFANAAWPQDEAGDGDAIEEIVVTGIRGALGQALDTKRNALAIVDAVNAEDIGKFPDQNVAESLSRVPGITVTRDFGEGEKVSIRGTQTNQNRTLLNGVSVASTDWFTLDLPSRGFNYLILPSNLVQSLEVYKSPQAEIQEGSLGGTVILNTRKPLDLDPLTVSIQTEGQYSDNSEEFDPQASGMFSWKNDAETFGALISYTRQERNVNRTGREVIRFLPPGASGNNTEHWFPRLIGEVDFRQARIRETVFGSAQWLVGDRLELALNALDTTLDANNINQNNLATLGADGAITDPASVVTAGSGVSEGVVAATVDTTPGRAGARQQAFDRIASIEAQSYDLNFDYDGGGWRLSGRLGMTDSEGGAPDQRYYAFASEGAGNAILAPAATVDAVAFDQNLNLRFLTPSGQEETDEEYLERPLEWSNATSIVNHEEETYLGVDFEQDLSAGFFNLVKFGFLGRERETGRDSFSTGYHWCGDDDHISLDGGWCAANNLRPDSDGVWLITRREPGGGRYLGSATTQHRISDFTAGKRGADYILIDSATARAVTDPQIPVITLPTLTDTWGVREESMAVYVKSEFGAGGISGDVGFRAVRTNVESTGYVIQGDADGAAAQMTPNASLLAGAFGCRPDTCKASLVTIDNSYTEFLPNVNISYDLASDLKLRLAAARVMSRPDPQALGVRENFFENTRAGTRGNPVLEPITASQFDVSLEWYFAEGAILAGTLFLKDISGNLVSSTSQEDRVDLQTGDTISIKFSTPRNGQNATISGIELLYQQPLLDRFGVVVNYTLTDADTSQERDPLNVAGSGIVVGASDHVLNLTGYYEDNRFDARLSYNYRSEYLNEAAYFGSEIWTDAYGQLDFSASFDVNEQVQITFDALNILDEKVDQFHLVRSRPSKLYDNDRRILAGINVNF